jgi:hypothetical protein
MLHIRGSISSAVVLVVLLAMFAAAPGAVTATSAAAATSRVATAGPTIELIPAQRAIELSSSHGAVAVDPGIWVASLDSPLEFDVQRASYSRPLTITQLIHLPSGKVLRRRLPGSVLESIPLGLLDFLTLTVKNSAGKTVGRSNVLFCPNSYDPERAVPYGPDSSPYPSVCVSDPFPIGMVWGIQKDWAVDPLEAYGPPIFSLKPGTYHITESVTETYRSIFHVSPRDATVTVIARVVMGSARSSRPSPSPSPRTPEWRFTPTAASSVPLLKKPPEAALPDLVAMPSWGISTSHTKSGEDLLSFGATVWVGHAPLDVEGFRSNGSPIMKAYQYFFEDGRIVGRVNVGTMGFYNISGLPHWRFEQFARYRLLNAAKNVAVQSHKVGFCISPTDAVDLLQPGAVWQPTNIGFTGQCGLPTALWVRENLPVGWGDTYPSSVPGNSFDITHVPNGTYYIQVAANPLGLLRETTTRNDVSLRKVILGGTPGHRTVTVPAYHGIDPE